MKIIAYSDVHGNKYALEQLQKTEDYKTADVRVFCGDAVAMGPYPNECIDSIIKNGDIFLCGNHDSYCAYGLPIEEAPYFNEDKKQHQQYIRSITTETNKNILKTASKDFSITTHGKTFFFTHFAWETDRLVYDDPDAPLPSSKKTGLLFNNVNADYIIIGHNHEPSSFTQNNKTFICVGSLGMKHPGNYIVINIDENIVSHEHKTINYNLNQLKADMLTLDYPRANKYASWFD